MKVAIVQYRLLHYRVALFEGLKEACALRGVELVLVHGQATRREAAKRDEGKLSWACVVENRVLEFGSRDLLWQPLPNVAAKADLVVVMQENRLLSNYPLLLSRLWSKRKIAYWGHGKNFQSDAPRGLRENWKSFFLTKIDWWFAYTSMTVDILSAAGYPTEKITQLDNAIDTDGFKSDLAACSDEGLATLREELDIRSQAPVAVFCGSLYPDKKLDLLIAAADLIFTAHPDFRLLIIGDGPSMPEVLEASRTRPWIKVLGVRTGHEKAMYFRVSDVMLNPGLVGLHIVDAFCAGLVMATTRGARHSPEVAYLEHGRNGLMTGDSVDEYAKAVLALFDDRILLDRMKAASLADSTKYTLSNMIERFADGIVSAIAK